MAEPIGDMVTFLAAVVGLSLTKGTDLFLGDFRGPNDNFPINCLFVDGLGGPEPDRTMGQVKEIRYHTLTLRLRWKKFGAGNLKAQAIQNALQGVSISGYLDVVALQSLPVSLGQSAEGHHLWSMGFMLTEERTA